MMHYRKGENVEKKITKDNLPFDDCMPKGQTDFLWMHVKGGTKTSNVIPFVKNALETKGYRSVVWSGSGGGVIKTISCAEILKRSYPLYQVTRMCYTSVEEHWIPQMDGLEEIIANRQIPCLHILMSLDAIDDSVAGLQKPNAETDFWVYNNTNASTSSAQRRESKGPRLHSKNQQQRDQQHSSRNKTKNQNKQKRQELLKQTSKEAAAQSVSESP